MKKILSPDFFFLISLLILPFPGFSQREAELSWVDSVFNSFTPEQKIAQLMVIRAYSGKDPVYNDSLESIILKWNPGGVCFFKGSPVRQALLTNRLQKKAVTPLLIAMDAEWGLGMRLDSTFSFPKAMTLGAAASDSLAYSTASCIALDCRRMGITMNFAPVIDINNNPLNPVIGVRSFGENRQSVAEKGRLYVKGLEDHGVISSVKHFPGHGDTETDSHHDLPVLDKSRAELDSTELYPFRAAISQGCGSVMVGHLYVPAIDSGSSLPATLSSKIICKLLREEMGFYGSVITDALDMQGAAKQRKPGQIEVEALLADNDILLLPQDIDIAIRAIRTAADSNLIPQPLIDEKCRKMLSLKYRAGLAKPLEIETNGLWQELNPVSHEVLADNIFKEAITVVKNQNNLLPLSFLDRRKIAVVSVGDTGVTAFQKQAADYAEADFITLPLLIRGKKQDSVLRILRSYNLLIIGIHARSTNASRRFGITDEVLSLVDSATLFSKSILVIFGSPYILGMIRKPDHLEAIIAAYEDNDRTRRLSAELIFGGFGSRGKLPVTVRKEFPAGTGIEIPQKRLEYVIPEEIGISSASLSFIDSIVHEGLKTHAYPGCQVEFAWKGKVFYRKAFGNPFYGDSIPVRNDDLFDLASLTKVTATTLALMKLYEEGRINPDEPLVKYLPALKGSNKASLTIREIMAHQAGLQPWIRFYARTLRNGLPDTTLYRKVSSPEFPFRVADSLFIRKDYPDSIYLEIIQSPLRESKEYKYSDLGFILLKLVVEKQSGRRFEQYLNEKFYRPLGLATMTFNPLEKFPSSRIIPTEKDTLYRNSQIRGDVHDPAAAMLGGIAGHAGLFSDANDLAIILQMLLNDGEYGGKRYFLPSTVREFTKSQFSGNRRGMGFDKPLQRFSSDGPSCQSASPTSFGHSGFTGTYIWADPENELLFVFLSNRVCPDASNQKISEMNIRTRIHQKMYDILNGIKNQNK